MRCIFLFRHQLHPEFFTFSSLLHPNNLSAHTLSLVIHVQHPDTTFWLAPTVSSAPRVEQQQPIVLVIPGDMTVPEHYTARVGKLLACHALTMMCIAQDMHDTDSAMPNHNLALNRQLLYYLVPLDIALHGYHRRNRLQFCNDPQNREVACVDNQLDICEMLPDALWQPPKVRDMCIGDNAYTMLQFGLHPFFAVYYLMALVVPSSPCNKDIICVSLSSLTFTAISLHSKQFCKTSIVSLP
jgi:hypothetical protein